MALREGGILRSILCAPRISDDVEAIAAGFTVIRTWEGVTLDLERKPLMSGVEDDDQPVGVYAFVVPGTQNVECFLVITKIPEGYRWEISRAGAAEMHVYYKDTEIAPFTDYFGGRI